MFIDVARLVKSVDKTEAEIATFEFVPALLSKLNEIVPSDEGAGIFNLVNAAASIPKLFAFLLIKPATYPAEDSTGTEISTEPALLDVTVNV